MRTRTSDANDAKFHIEKEILAKKVIDTYCLIRLESARMNILPVKKCFSRHLGEKEILKYSHKPGKIEKENQYPWRWWRSAGGGGGGGAERIYDLNIPALVKFSYTAERDDELHLVKGEMVVVMEKCSDGWWRGSHSGRVGWFLSNYVQEEVLGQEVAMLNGRAGGSASSVLHVVQTLYPLSSVTEKELNFEKGETMEVLGKPENDPEWWRCKNSHGIVGLVPKNYVVVLSDGPAVMGLGTGHGSPHIRHTGPSRTGKFAGKDWYYGSITRNQAECALNERGMEGDFLIRDSESSPSDFSISLKAAGKNKHFKVQQQDGMYCIGQRRFSSMEELVEHYKKAPIFTSEQGDKLYLVKALA
ncbi:Cytoplasmic protein NCK2 [Triplophysa tibetana]|uniref:Cytoplasmic protein NCK2 n=1 Tax=Triplophysa tibetana TaxID=1572043 RepID=A0A5A9P0J1_9TELE|nr:Cytoplasmic protein NCK2 [Triplophysa tibetana]